MSKAIHPLLKGAYQGVYYEKIPEGIWALVACESRVAEIAPAALLAFEELDFGLIAETAPPFEGITDFNEWVAHFNPVTWGDWLMVPKLFLMYLRTRQNLPALVATPDPFIDAVLRESRGILMWSDQFTEIGRMIESVGSTENASMIHKSICLGCADWQDTLKNARYLPTNQTLMQIFEERTVGVDYLQNLGYRDYILADWLSRHFIV